jgi:predicted DNA-binding transcriptional regulator AlpA
MGSKEVRPVRRAEIRSSYKVSKTTFWRWLRDGQFPQPRKVGGIDFWDAAEVDDWFRKQGEAA